MENIHEAHGSVLKFVLIALIVPILYVVINGWIRELMGGKKAENWYLGVDLTLAAFVSVGLYAFEPQTRLLPVFSWETKDVVALKNESGLAIALLLDIILLLVAMCIHKDFLDNHSPRQNPTKLQRFFTGLKNGILNNLLGLIAFFVSALCLRG